MWAYWQYKNGICEAISSCVLVQDVHMYSAGISIRQHKSNPEVAIEQAHRLSGHHRPLLSRWPSRMKFYCRQERHDLEFLFITTGLTPVLVQSAQAVHHKLSIAGILRGDGFVPVWHVFFCDSVFAAFRRVWRQHWRAWNAPLGLVQRNRIDDLQLDRFKCGGTKQWHLAGIGSQSPVDSQGTLR